MKVIALPVTFSNQSDNHFDHCEMDNDYSTSDTNEILGLQTIGTKQWLRL